MPNISTNRIKGVVIELNPRAEHHWRVVAELNWPIGRGLSLIKLNGLDVLDYCDNQSVFISQAFEFGMRNQEIKYIQYLWDENSGEMYVVISAGPTDQQRRLIANTLEKQTNIKTVIQRVGQYRELIRARRKELMKNFLRGLKANGELISDLTYVDYDPEKYLVFSGAVGADLEGETPFHLGPDEIYVIRQDEEAISPLGLRQLSDQSITLPQGHSRPKLPQPAVHQLDLTDLLEYIDKNKRLKLNAVALPFHSDMRMSR